jgi:hypothetical protein
VVVGKTSKWCPICLGDGRRVRRIRTHQRNGPLRLNQCANLPDHEPRFNLAGKWWQAGPVRRFVRGFIAPPLTPTDWPWFECWTIAHCPHCKDTVRVPELEYRRQFGLIRLAIIMPNKWERLKHVVHDRGVWLSTSLHEWMHRLFG